MFSSMKVASLFFFALFCNHCVVSFQLHRSAGARNALSSYDRRLQQPLTIQFSENPKGDFSSTPSEEEIIGESFESSVDWDAEWKKVVQNQDQPAQRPGSYKTQAEIAAIKATNKVAKNVFDASQEMKSKMPAAPNMMSLQGDWRFWIGILVIVSFGLSILSATSTQQVNESFYI
ncbi:hypothetical protein ACHAXM_007463 [Skeletonema potamos]